jgi:hypothetical protein
MQAQPTAGRKGGATLYQWGWGLLYASLACAVAEVSIDGKPIYVAFFWSGYRPHTLAARIVAVPNTLLALAGSVCLGIVFYRWAKRKLAG